MYYFIMLKEYPYIERSYRELYFIILPIINMLLFHMIIKYFNIIYFVSSIHIHTTKRYVRLQEDTSHRK